jgi:hypothetical protein
MSDTLLKVVPLSREGILGWKGVGTLIHDMGHVFAFTDDSDTADPKTILYAIPHEACILTTAQLSARLVSSPDKQSTRRISPCRRKKSSKHTSKSDAYPRSTNRITRVSAFLIGREYKTLRNGKIGKHFLFCTAISHVEQSVTFIDEAGATHTDRNPLNRYFPIVPYTKEDHERTLPIRTRFASASEYENHIPASSSAFSSAPRSGFGISEINHSLCAPPIEVPRCLSARQYLSIIEESQPD